MSVYDKANDLAKELADSEEYRAFLKAKENLAKDNDNLSLLEEFRKKQWEVQVAQMLGQEVDEELLQNLEQVYQYISLNPTINEYLMAEYRFTRLLGDIQKVLTESIEGGFIWPSQDTMLN
ncbi:MAG: YlbF family regulator [Zhaonellaceae bacterium]|jgi:cell fate (sporulation/competence/biofilm development) regulator YlbF (YheA/YmcA/DUF963 family)